MLHLLPRYWSKDTVVCFGVADLETGSSPYSASHLLDQLCQRDTGLSGQQISLQAGRIALQYVPEFKLICAIGEYGISSFWSNRWMNSDSLMAVTGNGRHANPASSNRLQF